MDKLWAIFVIASRFYWMLLTWPFLLLVLLSTNSIRRFIAKHRIKYTLEQQGLPKDLIKEVLNTYKISMKNYNIMNIARKYGRGIEVEST